MTARCVVSSVRMSKQAEVLLELHNTHHYQGFFANVRQAIAQGKFSEYVSWFKGLQGQGQPLEDSAKHKVASTKRWEEIGSPVEAAAAKRQKVEG